VQTEEVVVGTEELAEALAEELEEGVVEDLGQWVHLLLIKQFLDPSMSVSIVVSQDMESQPVHKQQMHRTRKEKTQEIF
jgi:hypothetical protein